jgi:hypothetical protein
MSLMDRFERALRALAEIPFLCPLDFMLDDIISLPPGWRDYRCGAFTCPEPVPKERAADCWVEWALWMADTADETDEEKVESDGQVNG